MLLIIRNIFGALLGIVLAFVAFDWLWANGEYHSLNKDWVTQKPTTNILFWMLSVATCALSFRETKFAEFVAFLALTLSVATIVVGPLIQADSGGAVRSVQPGMPSYATLIGVDLTALGIILICAGSRQTVRIIAGMFATALTIGICGTIGYAANQPIMYFEVDGHSTAMAITTAVQFVLLSITLFLSWRGTDGSKEDS